MGLKDCVHTRLHTHSALNQTKIINLNKIDNGGKRKIEAESYNHCCGQKVIIITYLEYVFVALGTQHAMRMRHIVICGLSGTAKFSHII